MFGLSSVFRHYANRIVGHDRFDGWLQIYIHHRNLYAKGHGEVGFIRNIFPFQSLMILWLFLKSIGDIPNWFVYIGVPVLITVKLILYWFVGYLWEQHKIFDKENDWNNERNKAMRKINEGTGSPQSSVLSSQSSPLSPQSSALSPQKDGGLSHTKEELLLMQAQLLFQSQTIKELRSLLQRRVPVCECGREVVTN